ncbi:hypothetical protein [Massilia endophytica]|uniref:hypothetical protein n=1 Tax=Massilia endophytica TaxID=2899220 RepID=UPI001E609FB8|nr:hypothetical protein [Massilia endophytica]UGQ48376.1 hypothetical protein LSQ66_07885 [Massilia endophytica]
MSQQINLFNPIFLKQRKVFDSMHMLTAISIVCALQLALLGYGHFVLGKLQKDAETGKAALESKQAEFNNTMEAFKPRQRSPELDAQIAQVQADIAALKRVEAVLSQGSLGNTAGYSEYFRAFARQNVNGLWLLGVSIVGAGVEISVHGRAMQAAMIPGYIQRLTGEPVMNGKTFADLQISRPVMAAAAPAGAAAAAVPAAAPPAPFVEFRLQSRRAEVEKK